MASHRYSTHPPPPRVYQRVKGPQRAELVHGTHIKSTLKIVPINEGLFTTCLWRVRFADFNEQFDLSRG